MEEENTPIEMLDQNTPTTEQPQQHKMVMKPLIESISPIALCVIYLVFLVLVGISLGVATVAPPMYVQQDKGVWQCPPNTTVFDSTKCTGYDVEGTSKNATAEIQVGKFSILNRRFKLYGQFKKDVDNYTIGAEISVTINESTLDDGQSQLFNVFNKRPYITCDIGDAYCQPFLIYTDSFTKQDTYAFTVNVKGSSYLEGAGELYFHLDAVSGSYTFFDLCWRFAFIFYSVIVVLAFLITFRKYKLADWIFEVRWTFALLIVLVIQNNPFYSYEYSLNTSAPEFFNISVIVFFYIFFLLYVLIIFEFYKNGKGTKKLVYWIPRILFFLLFFVSVEVTFVYNKIVGVVDPEFNPLHDIPSIVMASVSILFVVLYVFWLLYVVCRSCSEGKKIGKTKRKLRIFGALMLVSMFLFISLLGLSLFFGYQQTISINLTTVSFVNFMCTLLFIVNYPRMAEESQLWSEDRIKFTSLDDPTAYKQLPDNAISEIHFDDDEIYNDPIEKENHKREKEMASDQQHLQTPVVAPYDGSEAIDL
ncbi:hypothetical protein EIN_146060 [Entamoeba invadens IP1]|uniref:Wntless-like transmembrane domain-containing protein n=1 Tax=Entamoeba invadens IP1 TaxID=370355 RepID=L7FL27_ENTIV|nr:hypothetical protein EIN_146060 [Entamoeba invadens IP1]ELP87612.1 hypothetical protein EIN_146060 [Entamoeba invadens IP1]|eukprot:XP_004254383.1 hypothetical protein EIN_146060 [Entamoeba invadens IP1]